MARVTWAGLRRLNRRRGNRGTAAARMARGPFNYTYTRDIAIKALRKATRLQPEKKVYEINSTFNPDYSGTNTSFRLCIPAQGVSDVQRIGSSIKLSSLAFRASIQGNSLGGASQQCRVIIFKLKQPDTLATYTAAMLLETVGSVFGVLSPKNWDNIYQTKILYDKTFTVGNQTTTDSSAPVKKVIRASIKLGGMITKFNANTQDVESGCLYCLLLSNEQTNTPGVHWYSRVQYTDA